MPLANPRSHPLVILGAGYTGQFLFPLARAQGWDTLATSRAPATHLRPIPSSHRIEFDLLRRETWSNIPEHSHLIWCFPAIPQDAVTHFLENRLAAGGRLILLGSTSAYRSDPDKLVHEGTPPRLSLPRVKSEEYLRSRHGAIILRLAGLYGPGRHVLDWIRKGKVKHTDRYVNLIHIEDVASVCLTALEKGKDGEVYIVSDGIPRRWSEIFRTAHERWGMILPAPSEAKDSGKRLSIDKIRRELKYRFRFPDLYQALDDIEGQRNDSRLQASPK
jgi:nucleoside-diphosphate-sugar epimerase